MQMLHKILKKMEEKWSDVLINMIIMGCGTKLICSSSDPAFKGTGSGGYEVETNLERKEAKIVFPCKDKMDGHDNLFLHELQHRWDDCNERRTENTCFGSLCQEIRAYKLSHFENHVINDELKKKMMPWVKYSVKEYCKSIKGDMFNEQEFEAQYPIEYNKQFTECIK